MAPSSDGHLTPWVPDTLAAQRGFSEPRAFPEGPCGPLAFLGTNAHAIGYDALDTVRPLYAARMPWPTLRDLAALYTNSFFYYDEELDPGAYDSERQVFWQRALVIADSHLAQRPDPDPNRDDTYAQAIRQSLGWLFPCRGQILIGIHDHDISLHVPRP